MNAPVLRGCGGEVGVVAVVVVVVARDHIDMMKRYKVVMCVTWRWSRRGAAVSA